jgi:hypothetical protein
MRSSIGGVCCAAVFTAELCTKSGGVRPYSLSQLIVTPAGPVLRRRRASGENNISIKLLADFAPTRSSSLNALRRTKAAGRPQKSLVSDGMLFKSAKGPTTLRGPCET